MSLQKVHQAPHKDRREKAKGRELAEAKKEIHQLKRTVARLTKQIAKLLDERGEREEPNGNDEIELVKVHTLRCASCDSINVKTLKMPTFTLWVCKDCGWRLKQ